MPSQVDMEFDLSNHKVIKDLAAKVSMQDENKKCLGLIAYGQDFFYVWNDAESEIHAVNAKHSLRDGNWEEEVILRPRYRVLFEVEKLTLNRSCNLLCIQGANGVAAVHLPQTWEKESRVEVKCVPLAERLFLGEQHLLRCAKWHPGSVTDSHLVILTSDEFLRCYDALEGELLWSCLLSKHSVVSHLNIPSRVSLGDTPVDFDFVPPTDGRLDSVQWPILVLWGNGNIFHVSSTMSSDKPSVAGPLLMSPPSDDNYGSDASSLIVLRGNPPVVVLSTCSGTIYHSLLFTSSEDNEETETPNEMCLHVVEAIELDLGIVFGEEDDVISCPVGLLPDPVEWSRYYCIHAGGIHLVTSPLVSKMYKFVEDEGTDFSSSKLSSTVNYLLSTAVYIPNTSRVESKSSYECLPILGAAYVDLTMTIWVLLRCGKLITVKTTPNSLYSVQDMIVEKNANEDNKGLVYRIENILKEDGICSQPLMSLPPNTSCQSWLELILRFSQHLSTVLKTHEKISFELDARAKAVIRAAEEQTKEVARLQLDRSRLQETAETIAERYEELYEKYNALNQRVENVLKHNFVQGAGLTTKEANAMESLQHLEKKLPRFEKDLERIRATHEYQSSNSKERLVSLSNTPAFYIDDAKCRSIRKQLSEFSEKALELRRKLAVLDDQMISEGFLK